MTVWTIQAVLTHPQTSPAQHPVGAAAAAVAASAAPAGATLVVCPVVRSWREQHQQAISPSEQGIDQTWAMGWGDCLEG